MRYWDFRVHAERRSISMGCSSRGEHLRYIHLGPVQILVQYTGSLDTGSIWDRLHVQ